MFDGAWILEKLLHGIPSWPPTWSGGERAKLCLGCRTRTLVVTGEIDLMTHSPGCCIVAEPMSPSAFRVEARLFQRIPHQARNRDRSGKFSEWCPVPNKNPSAGAARPTSP